MKAVLRAVLKYPDQREQELTLFKVQDKCFRWVAMPSGRLHDGVDYLDERVAQKALRVYVESDPSMVGVDLTIRPMDPTVAERAAKLCLDKFFEYDYPGQLGNGLPEATAAIIEKETRINSLIDAAQTLIAYEIQRMRTPKPPGLDMAHGGLILALIEEIEKATGQNFDNIRKMLTQDVDQVKVFSSMPRGGKPR